MGMEIRPLREWRGVRGVTIRGLAELARVSPGVIVRAEAGGRTQAVTMVRLARALDVEPAQVAEWADRR